MVLDMLGKHTSQGKCPLAGNSVGQDRKFIDKYMPDLASWLHYRTVDVSTIKVKLKKTLNEFTNISIALYIVDKSIFQ